LIRELRSSDKEQFISLCNHFRKTEMTQSEFDELLELRNKQGIKTFVYIIDDMVVGTHAVIIEPKFLHNSNVAHLEDLIVDPDYRRMGIGEKLLENTLTFCRNMKCYKAIYTCSDKLVDYYSRTLNGYVTDENAMRTDFD